MRTKEGGYGEREEKGRGDLERIGRGCGREGGYKGAREVKEEEEGGGRRRRRA